MLHSYFISILQHKDCCKICCLGVITPDVQIVGMQFAWRRLLLSAQCVSSIGQITTSVCVSVSQSVCHTKRVERSTDHNLPPTFTELATNVESQRCGYQLFLVEIRNISIRQTGSGINPRHCSCGSKVMVPIDSPWVVSYSISIDSIVVSRSVFEIFDV